MNQKRPMFKKFTVSAKNPGGFAIEAIFEYRAYMSKNKRWSVLLHAPFDTVTHKNLSKAEVRKLAKDHFTKSL